jgi:hypothetical protein
VGVGSGLLLIASGELMHLHRSGVLAATPAAATVAATAPSPLPSRSISGQHAGVGMTIVLPAAATTTVSSKTTMRDVGQPAKLRASSKRADASLSPVVVRPAPQSSSRGILARFGLQWLRNVKFKSDL